MTQSNQNQFGQTAKSSLFTSPKNYVHSQFDDTSDKRTTDLSESRKGLHKRSHFTVARQNTKDYLTHPVRQCSQESFTDDEILDECPISSMTDNLQTRIPNFSH